MAQAAQTDTRSPFIAQLLAPITSPRERRWMLADLRREAEQAWSLVYHRYHAATALCSHWAHVRRAAEIERRSVRVPEAAEEARAQLALITAVDRMMHVPAPTIGALRQKQKLRKLDGGQERWEAAIAYDITRLERA